MAYLVLDLEWNTGSVRNRFEDPLRAEGKPSFHEILQLGAMVCDQNFSLQGPFDLRVRADVHDKMNPYISKVTGLKTTDLQNGLPFPAAWQEFKNRILEASGIRLNRPPDGPEDPAKDLPQDGGLLLSWGNSDASVLLDNLRHYELSTRLNVRVLDLQKLYSRLIAIPQSHRPALTVALHQVGLQENSRLRAHDAAADAYYTARILQRIVPYLREFHCSGRLPVRALPAEAIAADLAATREAQAPMDAFESAAVYRRLSELGTVPDFTYEALIRLPFKRQLQALLRHLRGLALSCPGCQRTLQQESEWDTGKRLRWSAEFACPVHGKVAAQVKLRYTHVRTGPIRRDDAGKVVEEKGRPGYTGRLRLKLAQPF